MAISDCEPDVAALEELLLEKAEHVLIKLSPMLDLALALNNLKHVQEAHIISVKTTSARSCCSYWGTAKPCRRMLFPFTAPTSPVQA